MPFLCLLDPVFGLGRSGRLPLHMSSLPPYATSGIQAREQLSQGHFDPTGISRNGYRVALGWEDRRVHVGAPARRKRDASVAILSEGHRVGESDVSGVPARDEGSGLGSSLQSVQGQRVRYGQVGEAGRQADEGRRCGEQTGDLLVRPGGRRKTPEHPRVLRQYEAGSVREAEGSLREVQDEVSIERDGRRSH